MDDLFDDNMNLDALNLDEEEEFEEQDKFKTALFGFNKRTVMNHINSLEKTIDQMQLNLEGQIKELINEKEGLAQEKNYLEQEYTQAKMQKEEIESELFSLNQEYQKVLIVLKDKEEFEKINQSLSLENSNLQDQNSSLQRQVQEINDLFELAKQQEGVYARKLRELEMALEEKESIIKEIENKNLIMNKEIEEHEVEIIQLNEQLKEAAATKEHLQEELKNKLAEIEMMSETLEDQKEEISKLNKEKQYFLSQKELNSTESETFVKDSVNLVSNLYENLNENVEQASDNDDYIAELKNDIRAIQQQLQTVQFQTVETQRISRDAIDQALLPLVKRLEYLESSNKRNHAESDYERLMERFIKTEDPQEISSLYHRINTPTDQRVRDYERKIDALEQQKQLHSNELEQKINAMYQRLSKSI